MFVYGPASCINCICRRYHINRGQVVITFVIEVVGWIHVSRAQRQWFNHRVAQPSQYYSIKCCSFVCLSNIGGRYLIRLNPLKSPSQYHLSILLQYPLAHFVSLILGGPQASAQLTLLLWKLCLVLTKVDPFVPAKLAEV